MHKHWWASQWYQEKRRHQSNKARAWGRSPSKPSIHSVEAQLPVLPASPNIEEAGQKPWVFIKEFNLAVSLIVSWFPWIVNRVKSCRESCRDLNRCRESCRESAIVVVNRCRESWVRNRYRTLHVVLCTLYNVHCTLYIVQCTMYKVQCTMYNVQCTMYNVQCAMCIVHCTVYSVHCTVYSV